MLPYLLTQISLKIPTFPLNADPTKYKPSFLTLIELTIIKRSNHKRYLVDETNAMKRALDGFFY